MTAPHRLRKPASDFTMVPNGLIRDPRLTLKAKGIYALLFSKPDDWRYIEDVLLRESKDGRDAFRAGVKELLDAGWLVKRQIQDGAGKFSHTEWLLTVAGKPGDGLAVAGQSAPTKTEGTKKEKDSPQPPPGESERDVFQEIVKAYPVQGPRLDVDAARHVWNRNKLATEGEAILAGLERLKASSDWLKEQQRFVPKLSNFLQGGTWRATPLGRSTEGPPTRNGEIVGWDGRTASERLAVMQGERERQLAGAGKIAQVSNPR